MDGIVIFREVPGAGWQPIECESGKDAVNKILAGETHGDRFVVVQVLDLSLKED